VAGTFPADPSWPRLQDLAARHGLLPLLYRAWSGNEGAALPRQAFVDLWAAQQMLVRRNAAMAAALVDLLAALDAAGLPALPYKGPVLAEALYGDVAMRAFGDLDLLIRPRDLRAAKDLLKARGFEPEYDLGPAQEAAFLRASAQYHLVLRHADSGLLVELHWRTDPDAAVEGVASGDAEAWWDARPREPFAGTAVRAFTPEELLLVLAIHGSKHHWERLAWLADLAALMARHPQLDWAWIAGRAAELRATRRLLLGLRLAHDLLGAAVPPDLLDRAACHRVLVRLATAIEAAAFAAAPRPLGAFARLRRDLALFESLRGKARFLCGALLEPSLVEWTRWPLPRGLAFLYPLLRLGRLTAKHLPGRKG
jgi:hypothetical protein